MSGLLFMVLIVLVIYFIRLFKKVEYQGITISCPHKSGTLTVELSHDRDQHPAQIELAVRRWALTASPTVTDSTFESLNRVLSKFDDCHVRNITFQAPPIPEPTSARPAPPTEAQRLDQDIMIKVECAETLMHRLAWLKVEKPEVAKSFLKSGRTIAREVEDMKDEEFQGLEDALKHKVNGLFHDPNRVR